MTCFTIAEVGPADFRALSSLFEASSSTCFCRYWHFTGSRNDWLDRCANRPEDSRAELSSAVATRDPTSRGLVALDGERVVGWMKLTAREEVPKLRGLPVYRAVLTGSDTTTYSIGCFLVDPIARRRGATRALVRAAPAFVRSWGGTAIEAYPRRSAEPLHPEEAWQGPERVFVEAGFEAVHSVGPYPVYRLVL